MTEELQLHPLASPDSHERIAALANELGFTDVRLYRRGGIDPLVHARWKGAPVALSLRSGIAGGFSVAFYSGPAVVPQSAGSSDAESNLDDAPNTWVEVADTAMPFSDELALVLGAAVLERYGDPSPFVGIPMPGESG